MCQITSKKIIVPLLMLCFFPVSGFANTSSSNDYSKHSFTGFKYAIKAKILGYINHIENNSSSHQADATTKLNKSTGFSLTNIGGNGKLNDPAGKLKLPVYFDTQVSSHNIPSKIAMVINNMAPANADGYPIVAFSDASCDGKTGSGGPRGSVSIAELYNGNIDKNGAIPYSYLGQCISEYPVTTVRLELDRNWLYLEYIEVNKKLNQQKIVTKAIQDVGSNPLFTSAKLVNIASDITLPATAPIYGLVSTINENNATPYLAWQIGFSVYVAKLMGIKWVSVGNNQADNTGYSPIVTNVNANLANNSLKLQSDVSGHLYIAYIDNANKVNIFAYPSTPETKQAWVPFIPNFSPLAITLDPQLTFRSAKGTNTLYLAYTNNPDDRGAMNVWKFDWPLYTGLGDNPNLNNFSIVQKIDLGRSIHADKFYNDMKQSLPNDFKENINTPSLFIDLCGTVYVSYEDDAYWTEQEGGPGHNITTQHHGRADSIEPVNVSTNPIYTPKVFDISSKYAPIKGIMANETSCPNVFGNRYFYISCPGLVTDSALNCSIKSSSN